MSRAVIGRDAELAALDHFLAGLPSAAAALVLSGPAGAGKTTLLRAGVELARDRGFVVLQTMPARSDMPLAFSGLADLLDGRLDALAGALPPPQRRALGTALLIEDPLTAPPEPRLIAAAFRTALDWLASSAPVVVVIDDVQWLDAPTSSVVSYVARRLGPEKIGLLCAERTADPDLPMPLDLDRAQLPGEVLPVGGLSLGALHHLLGTRLGISLPRTTLRKIHADSAGNPFAALEIGRALRRRGAGGSGALPVPRSLNDLIGERIGELPAPVVDALSLIAVMPGGPLSRYLEAGLPADDLDAAVVAGVIQTDGGTVQFAHPLLAAAVLGSIPPARRRALHALAADRVTDTEEQARHRALAAAGPSESIAGELDSAAATAERRGAPATSAELLELAARLTPADQADDRHRRLLTAGKLHHLAGDTRRAIDLLRDLAAETPAGPRHAEVIAHLAWHDEDDFGASTRLLEDALAEAGDSPALRATIQSFLADHWAITGNPERARSAALEALQLAEQTDDLGLLASLLAFAFFCDVRCGVTVDEGQLRRALALEHHIGPIRIQQEPPSQLAGIYLTGLGRLDEARRSLEQAMAWAEANGSEYVRADVYLRMSIVATRTGAPAHGADLAQAGLEIAEQLDLSQLTSAVLYGCGFAALHRGQPAGVRDAARRGQELSRSVGDHVFLGAHERLLGSLDLALGNTEAACTRLMGLADSVPDLGRRFEAEWAPEAIEALIASGRPEEAAQLLSGLEDRCAGPVTAAVAARCRGALAAARGALGDAVSELENALALHDATTLEPVPRGRTLLMLGAVQRRLLQRRAARDSFTAALNLFTTADASLWADRARAECDRVSGRVPSLGELTATEERVAHLVADGLSNRQAAAELFVSVRAIESNLTKIYAKLGVRSRTELARHVREEARVRSTD